MSSEPSIVVAKQGLTQMGSSLASEFPSGNEIVSIEVLMILIGFLGIIFIGGYILMAYIIITGSQVLRGRKSQQMPIDLFKNNAPMEQVNRLTAPILSATESLPQQQQQQQQYQPNSSDRKYVIQSRN